jgi:hypothetical protein
MNTHYPSQVRVYVMPSPPTNPEYYLLAAAPLEPGDFDGWAREDGTFAKGEWMTDRMEEGIVFRTPFDAIEWAEARGWEVVNHLMYRRLRVPRRFAIHVTGVERTPIPHSTIEARQVAGEKVGQIALRFDAIDALVPLAGCHLIVDDPTIKLLEDHKIKKTKDLVGYVVVVETDNPSDLFRPMRLVRVVEAARESPYGLPDLPDEFFGK